MENITLLFREDERGSDGHLSVPVEKSQQESEAGEAIVCRQCGHPVTESRSRVDVNGFDTHTFFNPAGIVFEIGCFNSAPGCWVHGPASREFSWFAGYSWRLALCNSCTTHLGWFFSSKDTTFFGLILKKLVIP